MKILDRNTPLVKFLGYEGGNAEFSMNFGVWIGTLLTLFATSGFDLVRESSDNVLGALACVFPLIVGFFFYREMRDASRRMDDATEQMKAPLPSSSVSTPDAVSVRATKSTRCWSEVARLADLVIAYNEAFHEQSKLMSTIINRHGRRLVSLKKAVARARQRAQTAERRFKEQVAENRETRMEVEALRLSKPMPMRADAEAKYCINTVMRPYGYNVLAGADLEDNDLVLDHKTNIWMRPSFSAARVSAKEYGFVVRPYHIDERDDNQLWKINDARRKIEHAFGVAQRVDWYHRALQAIFNEHKKNMSKGLTPSFEAVILLLGCHGVTEESLVHGYCARCKNTREVFVECDLCKDSTHDHVCEGRKPCPHCGEET